MKVMVIVGKWAGHKYGEVLTLDQEAAEEAVRSGAARMLTHTQGILDDRGAVTPQGKLEVR